MSAIEFLQGFGWICIAAYCLNNLGLVPQSWISAAQSGLGVDAAPAQISPMPSVEASPNVTQKTPDAAP